MVFLQAQRLVIGGMTAASVAGGHGVIEELQGQLGLSKQHLEPRFSSLGLVRQNLLSLLLVSPLSCLVAPIHHNWATTTQVLVPDPPIKGSSLEADPMPVTCCPLVPDESHRLYKGQAMLAYGCGTFDLNGQGVDIWLCTYAFDLFAYAEVQQGIRKGDNVWQVCIVPLLPSPIYISI